MESDEWVGDLVMRSERALIDHLHFARYVQYTEQIGEVRKGTLSVANALRYQDAWFQMEIVNALALDAWGSDGSPSDWEAKWCASYRSDAQEVVSQFVVVVSSLRESD